MVTVSLPRLPIEGVEKHRWEMDSTMELSLFGGHNLCFFPPCNDLTLTLDIVGSCRNKHRTTADFDGTEAFCFYHGWKRHETKRTKRDKPKPGPVQEVTQYRSDRYLQWKGCLVYLALNVNVQDNVDDVGCWSVNQHNKCPKDHVVTSGLCFSTGIVIKGH